MNELIKTLVEHPWGTFCLGGMIIWWTVMAAKGAKRVGDAFGAFFVAFFDSLFDMGWTKDRDEMTAKLAQAEKAKALAEKKYESTLSELDVVHGKLGAARGLILAIKSWPGGWQLLDHTGEVDKVLAETAHTLNEDLTCDFDPTDVKGPIGMFHCPQCGEMVVAGRAHPDYSVLAEQPEGAAQE